MLALQLTHFLSRALCLAFIASAATVAVGVGATAPPTLANAQQKLAAMSVPFIPNAGQWDAKAAFAAQTFAGTLFVTKAGELVYSLPGKPINVGAGATALQSQHEAMPSRRLQRNVVADLATLSGVRLSDAKSSPTTRTPGWVLSETLVDAKGNPRSMSQSTLKAPAGYRPMEGKVSYAIGNNPSKHANNLNTYERVNLGDMYPGVNVQLRATGNNVEKIFTVAPRHDPKRIHIKLAGATKLEIGTQGELIAHTGNGPVAFTAPIAFQENAQGERVSVDVAYALVSVGADLAALPGTQPSDAKSSPTTAGTYRFTLGAYDTNQPLVIDPLLQSTYLGGTGSDQGSALAIHPATGEVYIAGTTDSTDLPGVTGGAQSAKSTGYDAFVTRFNAQLTTRLQSSYLGGTGTDQAYALAIHPTSGEVYVAGNTSSTDLPGVAGSQQSVYGGGIVDAFVTRFNAALTVRLQSSYVGGAGNDFATALVIHPLSGDVYVAGYTNSTDLPGLAGGAQSAISTEFDAFVTRFDAALTTRLQSSYLGGMGTADYAYALAIHPASGEVYVAGTTTSIDLPGVIGGAQSVFGGDSYDAFVTRFNAALTMRLQSSYLGGTGNDYANALAIHPASGEVYVAGSTSSTDLPSATGGAQSAYGSGLGDTFVTRFNATLTTRLQSSYLGGTGGDGATALAIHPATGEVYVAGYTSSTDLPGAAGGAQSAKSSFDDVFVARFNAQLTTRLQSSYLGGTGTDQAYALAIHPTSGEVYVAGNTSSTDLPAVAGGAQSAKSTGNDTFVSRFSASLAGAASCNLDIDQDNAVRASTDGLLILRRMLGLSGAALIANAVSPAGLQTDDIAIGNAIDALLFTLDIDGSGGAASGPTDGLILLRAMLGFTGTAVTTGAIIGTPPRSTWALIRPYLNASCGTSFLP
jgi:hypothetical protein